MPDMSAPIKLGANCWNQYTDWPSFLAAMQRAEGLGYESLVTVRAGGTVLTLRVDAGVMPAIGDVMTLAVEPSGLHWFDAGTGARL